MVIPVYKDGVLMITVTLKGSLDGEEFKKWLAGAEKAGLEVVQIEYGVEPKSPFEGLSEECVLALNRAGIFSREQLQNQSLRELWLNLGQNYISQHFHVVVAWMAAHKLILRDTNPAEIRLPQSGEEVQRAFPGMSLRTANLAACYCLFPEITSVLSNKDLKCAKNLGPYSIRELRRLYGQE